MKNLSTDMMMMLRRDRKIPTKKTHLKKSAQKILRDPTAEHHKTGSPCNKGLSIYNISLNRVI